MSNSTFVIYDSITGEILRNGNCSSDVISAQAQAGEAIISDVNTSSLFSFVDVTGTPTLTAKSTSPVTIDITTVVADGVTPITVSNIPNPSKVRVKSGSYHETTDVTDGTLAITFDTAGTYRIHIHSRSALTKTIEVTATLS